MNELLGVLAATGDIGIWALVLIMWKFNNRILTLEIVLDKHIIQNNADHQRIEKTVDTLVDTI